ncbi:hypothetical protein [Burkholderia stagnalis]|uniref:hypothetical protein n=1 Tax=Burkholderia stagnalis TaxID=1503054 RepID=UPI00075D9A8B|nr:hypothetical protein [Burkholderia stagnalis]KVC55107.1 hypothetical protein WS59_29940 [Burkholderia stagnalis]KVN08875.1 hypothetical protein WT10_32575 [Burkholderia stagnalis]RQX89629.1 hypothetical protein DF121_30800 [Burkholderia stagnalis]
MYTYDANGNLVWTDTSGVTTQPASMWSDPVTTQNAVTSPSELNPSAGTWGDVLAYGLTRAIDVGTIKALSPDNNMPLMPGTVSVNMNGRPTAVVGVNRGLLMLMAIGAVLLFVEERK